MTVSSRPVSAASQPASSLAVDSNCGAAIILVAAVNRNLPSFTSFVCRLRNQTRVRSRLEQECRCREKGQHSDG